MRKRRTTTRTDHSEAQSSNSKPFSRGILILTPQPTLPLASSRQFSEHWSGRLSPGPSSGASPIPCTACAEGNMLILAHGSGGHPGSCGPTWQRPCWQSPGQHTQQGSRNTHVCACVCVCWPLSLFSKNGQYSIIGVPYLIIVASYRP